MLMVEVRVQFLCTAAVWAIAMVLAAPASSQTPPSCSPSPSGDNRPVSLKTLFPNILCDQKRIWTFPLRLAKGQDVAPTLLMTGSAVGLVALDPEDTPYFRRTGIFDPLNDSLSSLNASMAIVAVPLSFYAAGMARHSSYAKHTALLMGEAVADSELLATALKDVDERLRPKAIGPHGNFSDSWFDNRGNRYWSSASFPSGHAIAAFAIATVIAHRYRSHKWIPYTAFGVAALIGFSRISESAHFPSDVFVGAALGYTITRSVVLR